MEKKLCGILTEGISDFETGQIEHLILGIGINTTVKDFPAELLATAGAAEGTYSKSALAAETITQALGYIEDLDSASFLQAYKEKSLVIGKTVTVYQGRYKVNPEDEITGVPARVLDIADDGGLIVLYADGRQEKLVSRGNFDPELNERKKQTCIRQNEKDIQKQQHSYYAGSSPPSWRSAPLLRSLLDLRRFPSIWQHWVYSSRAGSSVKNTDPSA